MSDDDDLGKLFEEADDILAHAESDSPPKLGSPVSEPALWSPLPGWGTIRDYAVVRNDDTLATDVGCVFIPDDGSKALPLFWYNVEAGSVAVNGAGEFARGVMVGEGQNRHVTIKITPDGMTRFEELANQINALDAVKRAVFGKSREHFYATAGYGHDISWYIVKAAPGLLRD